MQKVQEISTVVTKNCKRKSNRIHPVVFNTISVSMTQLCFNLKATGFRLDIDQHQAKKCTIIKRQVKMKFFFVYCEMLYL